MIKKVALGFSVILHPLLIPTVGIIILLNSGSYLSELPFSTKKLLVLLTFSGTCFFPALMIPFIYMRGLISDIQMTDLHERMLPISIALIFYLLTFILFLSIPVYRFMHGFILGSLLEVLLTLIISFRWKISIHMIGMGGLVAFLLVISVIQNVNLSIYLMISILASGIAASSRLILDVHSIEEIISGFIAGALIMSGCLVIFYQS